MTLSQFFFGQNPRNPLINAAFGIWEGGEGNKKTRIEVLKASNWKVESKQYKQTIPG